MRIAVIGAGPAGSTVAYHLAKAGKEVHVFEEHKTIGKPIRCTGIVTSRISELAPTKKYVVNETREARIFSPDGKYAGFHFSDKNIIMCRTRFDRFLAQRAKKAGAHFHLEHRYLSHTGNSLQFKAKGKKKRLQADVIIGADGPDSGVAKSAGLYGRRQYFMGVQAVVKADIENIVEFHTGIGDFAWVVPESQEKARIGLCARTNANELFQAFLKKRLGRTYKRKVRSRQAGLIPVYDPRLPTQNGNTYLLGDAAGMVKATTAGGIIQGMVAAEELAESIISAGDYQKRWKARIGKDLYLHLLMRRVMDRFTEKDYNALISVFTKERNRRVLEEFERDYPTRYLFRLMFSEPRLAAYARVLLRKSKVENVFRTGDAS